MQTTLEQLKKDIADVKRLEKEKKKATRKWERSLVNFIKQK